MSSIKYKGQTYSGASSIEDASHVIATDASGNLTTVQALLDAGAGIVELTQAQYDALPTATKNDGRIYAITDGTTTAIAEDVRYDNTNSGLTASNVQDAVDEITTTVSENFDDVFGDFASIEASSTASKAYAVGDYLVYDSKFYKVTSAISQGDTIVPDTNVEQTTVADEFSNASNVDYSNTTSGLAATNVQGAVDELNSNYTISESRYTALGKTWFFYKCGKIVFMNSPNDITSASAGEYTLFTLPAQLRPIQSLRVRPGNTNFNTYVTINSTGVVQVYISTEISSANNFAYTVTYFTA